ncbi:glycoside hydrolase family 13 protein [Klenkia brasiliensis]|uniref:Alpha-glucosidase n=1 Tax=Klenkia brasiliensis TaxID=333142 RepID=A0A1G7ZNX9_9ACTN|nr:glycoside hydrolase family 13 protein [Klenkia brasiliensis]SDH10335.1 alpha-glucosidase [Klenkia brasiliensis]
MSGPAPWWRRAVVYEVYVRSFASAGAGRAHGLGDVAGIRSRLPHLTDLGVDALWITPWYPSPMADGGYDVADHCDVDPRFGTLDDVRALLADAHDRGLRVLVDLVPNHTSIQHPWFTEDPSLYVLRPGRGDGPPNDWISAFGGPAWTRLPGSDLWYLHTFAPEQPDLDWSNPEVRRRFDDVLRFWLDLGVDGLRVDAVPAIGKDLTLPDAGHEPGALFASSSWVGSPQWDGDWVHDVVARWRTVVDEYPGDRVLVSESVVAGPERAARYVAPGRMHTTFNFDHLHAPWDPAELRAVVDATLAALAPTGAPATWVLSNHDETRHVTRFGRRSTGVGVMGFDAGEPSDPVLGLRRARAAALLMLALPGSAYLFQGEELGLPEVTDLPEELLQDPTWERSGHTSRGRDGCRVPLPWSGSAPPFGFGAEHPWLPQPAAWAELTAQAQDGDPGSTLTLYRTALRLRRELLAGEEFGWDDAPPEVLSFTRGRGLRCVVNLGTDALPLVGEVLLASGPVPGGELPPDTAAWLSVP